MQLLSTICTAMSSKIQDAVIINGVFLFYALGV